MSYVRLFKILPNGDTQVYGEARNNHGFAPLIWEWLGKKYNKIPPDAYLHGEGVLEQTWAMFGKGELERWENILLGASFDRVWVKRELIPELVDALRRFYQEYVTPRNYVETTLQIADLLGKLLQDPEARGVAFNPCSACEPFWRVYDAETDTCTPYNVDTQQPAYTQNYGDGKTAWELSSVVNGESDPSISEK